MLHAFRLLAKLKVLRGTRFDPFGWSADRKLERRLIVEYEALIDELIAGLKPANHATAVALASLPDKVRGFGHIKDRSVEAMQRNRETLLHEFRNSPVQPLASAA